MKNEHTLSNLLHSYQGEFLPFQPFATKRDRAQWDAIPSDARDAIVTLAKEDLNYDYPIIPTVRFMDFLRNGNRTRFQDIFFNRRKKLNNFVLAECCANDGTFLDDVINGLMAVCEESGWLLPSHNRYEDQEQRHLIPDSNRPIIDLFTAETGAQLAMIGYLLKDDLDAQSELFMQRIRREIKKRIEVPYLTEFFWWMGVEGKTLNNWTPWCTSNVLTATLLMDDITPEDKRKMLEKACVSLDYFITGYEEDGFCAEGPSYYHAASLALFAALRIVNSVTGGHFQSDYETPKIKNMVTYIMDVHVADDIYTNYSDCASHLRQGSVKKYLAAKEIGSQEMMQFAATVHQLKEGKTDTNGINLYERTQTLWFEQEIRAVDIAQPLPRHDRFFAQAGMFITRGEHLFLASLGGTNEDPHGHNDKGSIILYKDGQPILLDAGVESYSKKTFSPERYTIWTMQTAYHNVITFGEEHQQTHGKEYASTVLDVSCGDTQSHVCYELAGAYKDCLVASYQRSICLEKGKELTICDKLSSVPEGSFLPLMTLHKPEYQDGCLMVDGVSIAITGCTFGGSEEIVFTDEKLKHDWGTSLYRTKMMVCAPEVTLTVKD